MGNVAKTMRSEEQSALKQIIEGAKALSKGEVDFDLETRVRGELASIAKYINETRKKLAHVKPGLNTVAHELPSVSHCLADVTKTTETATHKILGIVEHLLDSDEQVLPDVECLKENTQESSPENVRQHVESIAGSFDERGMALVDLMTHLSFQDLTSQTLQTIAELMDQIENRVLELLIRLGERSAEPQEESTATQSVELLLGKDHDARQNMIDDLLKQYEL